jgi:DnaJ family protein C protein 7
MAESEDPRAGEAACWRRCLQDAGSAIYHQASLLRPHLLKAEALQGLERWGEAAAALEQCVASGPGAQERSVHEKLAQAQFLVRKAARPELYALLGCSSVGSAAQAKASEKELRSGYKRAALEWHPDRHVDKGPAARKEAEAKFKALGEALDVLTDPFKRKLWDEGHDLESIAQHVQRRDQQAGDTPGR